MAENKMYLTTTYLTTKENPKGPGLLSIISLGSPQLGDANIDILAFEVCDNQAEAEAWYARMKIERPWEARQ